MSSLVLNVTIQSPRHSTGLAQEKPRTRTRTALLVIYERSQEGGERCGSSSHIFCVDSVSARLLSTLPPHARLGKERENRESLDKTRGTRMKNMDNVRSHPTFPLCHSEGSEHCQDSGTGGSHVTPADHPTSSFMSTMEKLHHSSPF